MKRKQTSLHPLASLWTKQQICGYELMFQETFEGRSLNHENIRCLLDDKSECNAAIVPKSTTTKKKEKIIRRMGCVCVGGLSKQEPIIFQEG